MLHRPAFRALATGLFLFTLFAAPGFAAAESTSEPDLPNYVELKDRTSTHESGRIKMTIFLDFYCSHCHHFDTVVVPVLEKEYGKKLEVTYVGYPIVDPQASHIPVLAYYLAEEQGKGEAMRLGLFAAIWDHRLDVSRPDILLGVAQKAGLDLELFKQGFNSDAMRSRLDAGVADGKAIGLRGTPTIMIDNHLRVLEPSLKVLQSIFVEVLEGKV